MSVGVSMFIGLICSWLVLVLLILLSGLREGFPLVERLKKIGGKVMSVIDAAITRFTLFTQGVLDQLKSARSSNEAQTAKIAELSAALDVALADDNADKAAIAALQAEVASLQQDVADQINAAVDSLENPPGEAEVVEEPAEVVEEPVEVVEEPVEVVEEPVEVVEEDTPEA